MDVDSGNALQPGSMSRAVGGRPVQACAIRCSAAQRAIARCSSGRADDLGARREGSDDASTLETCLRMANPTVALENAASAAPGRCTMTRLVRRLLATRWRPSEVGAHDDPLLAMPGCFRRPRSSGPQRGLRKNRRRPCARHGGTP